VKDEVRRQLADDFNIPGALKTLQELVRATNSYMDLPDPASILIRCVTDAPQMTWCSIQNLCSILIRCATPALSVAALDAHPKTWCCIQNVCTTSGEGQYSPGPSFSRLAPADTPFDHG
jgi:hypothetical protein